MKPTPAENQSFVEITDEVLKYCGAEDCPGKLVNNTNLAPIDDITVSEGMCVNVYNVGNLIGWVTEREGGGRVRERREKERGGGERAGEREEERKTGGRGMRNSTNLAPIPYSTVR